MFFFGIRTIDVNPLELHEINTSGKYILGTASYVDNARQNTFLIYPDNRQIVCSSSELILSRLLQEEQGL